MADSADLNSIVASVDEKQPVVASPKSYFFGTALQGFHVTSAGLGETMEGMQ
jgi:hypothetical protein